MQLVARPSSIRLFAYGCVPCRCAAAGPEPVGHPAVRRRQSGLWGELKPLLTPKLVDGARRASGLLRTFGRRQGAAGVDPVTPMYDCVDPEAPGGFGRRRPMLEVRKRVCPPIIDLQSCALPSRTGSVSPPKPEDERCVRGASRTRWGRRVRHSAFRYAPDGGRARAAVKHLSDSRPYVPAGRLPLATISVVSGCRLATSNPGRRYARLALAWARSPVVSFRQPTSLTAMRFLCNYY